MRIFVLILAFLLAGAGWSGGKAASVSMDDGIAVWYRDEGNRDAVPLIFIHGWACDSSFWRFQTPFFADRYRVIALDLPGFGASGKPRNVRYTLALFAKAVKAVMDDAGARKPVLVGHSMGYGVIARFLADFPGEARAVVNVDGSVMRLPEDPAEREMLVQGMAALAESLAGEEVLEGFLDSLFMGKTPADLQREIREAMTTADVYARLSAIRELVRPEWWEERAFAVPAMAVYSENPAEDPGLETYLKNVFPGSQFHLWNDTGHFLMMEQPDRFNQLLLAFLRTLQP